MALIEAVAAVLSKYILADFKNATLNLFLHFVNNSNVNYLKIFSFT